MRNEEIVRRCERLKGYSRFIAKVHDLESAGGVGRQRVVDCGVVRARVSGALTEAGAGGIEYACPNAL